MRKICVITVTDVRIKTFPCPCPYFKIWVLFHLVLRCYECNGVGINDKCMVDPSAVAKQVICAPNETCYVKRSTIDENSVVPSNGGQWVSRGCIVSDVVGLMKYR